MNLLDDLDLGVLQLDKDFKILSMNFWLKARLVGDDQSFIGQNFFELFPSSDKPMIRRQFKAAISLGTTAFLDHKLVKYLVPIQAVRPFDSFFEFMPQDCRVGPIRNVGKNENGEDGEITGLFVSLQDASETARYENEMARKNRELEEANRVREQFLSNMSHELRTPLNSILGFADLLVYHEPENVHELGSQILGSGNHLLQIVNDILDFSKLKAGQLHLEQIPFSLDDQIKVVYSQMIEKAKNRKLTLSPLPEETELVLIGDPTRFRQMLSNLLENAIKFTEQGGVNIGLEIGDEPGQIRIAIDDTGVGIPEEKVKFLLEHGGQSDESQTRTYGGLGLGLPLAHAIAQKMRGGLTILARRPQGTRALVDIWLDVAGEHPNPEEMRIEIAQKKLKILLTEDNLMNQKLATKLLNKLDPAMVHIANNGLESITMNKIESYDLVLMDIQMPVMDGITATRQIRELGLNVPIIALTANATQDSFENAKEAGMQNYLTKPLTLDTLTECIYKTLIKIHRI